MSKTATRKRSAPSAKNGAPRQKRKNPQPLAWYQRVGMTAWIVAGLVAAMVVFALMSRSSDAPPEGPTTLPVVGADLHSLVLDPTDPARLFIGSHQGVSVSSDGGDTWEVVRSLDGSDAMGWAFADEEILVGGHPGLYVSSDGGETFEQRNEGLPNTDVHALGAGEKVIYAGIAGAGTFASTDSGRTWEPRSAEVGGAFIGRILVDPADDDHLIAPDMQGGAMESRDGGRSWESLGGVEGAMWVSWDPSDIEVVVVTAVGSAARSRDGGRTWDALEIPAGASIVEFSPDGPETLYAAVHEDPEARVWISTDDGETWDQL